MGDASVDDLGRPTDRPGVVDSVVTCGRGSAVEGTAPAGTAGSFFPALPTGFTVRMVGPGTGEFDSGGIEEAVVDLVVVVVVVVMVVVTLFLIVPSNDLRPSSTEKPPKSSWENIAAVISPIESTGSISACPHAEEMVDMDALEA